MTDFIEEAIYEAQIVLTTEPMASGELRCQLKSNTAQLVRELRIRDGAIISASALLYHLLLNIQAFRMCDDFEDWLDEFDIDLPQDKAEKKYKQMQTDGNGNLAITWLDAEMSPVPVSVSVPAVIVVAPL